MKTKLKTKENIINEDKPLFQKTDLDVISDFLDYGKIFFKNFKNFLRYFKKYSNLQKMYTSNVPYAHKRS